MGDLNKIPFRILPEYGFDTYINETELVEKIRELRIASRAFDHYEKIENDAYNQALADVIRMLGNE